MRPVYFVVLFFAFPAMICAQSISNLRTKIIPVRSDTVYIDTLSIAPKTLRLISSGAAIDTSAFTFDFMNARIIWKKNAESYQRISGDSVQATYRVFSFLIGKEYQFKTTGLISKGEGAPPLYYNPGTDQPELFRMPGLTRNGSISRGITFGNNQDVFVNSSLNLQLAGKLSENVDILAAITDENIPVQAEGNTQQLQDFDKVFIQLSNNRNRLIAGDFELRRPDSYFMNFYKKGQGGYFRTEIPLSTSDTINKKRILRSGISVAVSKGKFARNTIPVTEGNQGPYKLTGANGETFIIILSGTEKIFVDGLQLVRGAQNDYVIDYNTAELTFTARRFITKDSRVVAEFQYSDKNYSRSLIFLNNEYESNKLKVKLNVYSEQDSKNQPLSLDLDSAKKAVLANAGDSVQNAVYPTADSVQFTSNAVLYQRIDTLVASGVYTIYVYSNNPDSAYWQLSFSDVGSQRGDYVQDINSVNGRVFRWVEPVNGIHQGNFAPVGLLISPKKQQLVTAGVEYKINKRNAIITEGAYSNYDINLLSKKDKSDDQGLAGRIIYTNEVLLEEDTSKGWRIATVLNHEYAGKYFRPVERFRNVEFERDWNLGAAALIPDDENISLFQTSLIKPSKLALTYQLRSYKKGSTYNGLMNSSTVTANVKKFSALANGSYLRSEGRLTRTAYLRHSGDISHPVKGFVVGVRENAERNKFYSLRSDSILASSFAYQEVEGYVNTSDTAHSRASLSVKQRTDQLPSENKYKISTVAQEANLSTEFSRNPDNTFRTTTTYRTLIIRDTTLTQQEPVKTVLNRIDHTLNLLKGILSFNTYYEIGTGQERKQEYYYLRVNDGQGVYAFVDDNHNGVEDLNEFTIAAFQDQANYIRVFVPTNEYISTRSNQFSEVFVISPSGNRSSSQNSELFIKKFSNQISVRLDRKTRDESLLTSLNPFTQDLSDTLLISATSNIRNTLYFNKTNPVFGTDLTFQENRSKSFLTNGFETRIQRSRIINTRWNMTREFLATVTYENGDKINQSDFFSTRDYSIYSNSIEPRISYQPENKFRVTASYQYEAKKNTTGDLGERAISNRFSAEGKYNTVNSGSMMVKVSLININYTAADDSFLSYEMLEGFKNGKNYTWSAAIQRSLNNSVQLSLTYDGRKLQDSKVIHTGGVQFRANF